MRFIPLLLIVAAYQPALIQSSSASELEKLRSAADEARKAAAADPAIKDASSPPVKAYLIEQKRRRLATMESLRERIEQFKSDPAKENLVPVLKQQLADLESKPLEKVSFDAAYGYSPTTGLVGYTKKVRLLQNTSDGKSMIAVDNVAVIIAGLGTSQYASGKFFAVDKAILVGEKGPDQTVNNITRPVFAASLVDLEAVLKEGTKD